MPPRFIERLEKQSAAYRKAFGEPRFDPPPYPFSRAPSVASTSTVGSQSNASRGAPPPQYYQINKSTGIGFDAPAVPAESLILVTGASGWQGMHVVDQLLEYGYRVRGTVRTAEKAVWTSKYFKDKYGAGRYMPAVIPDMVTQGAFDIAVRGCSAVIHCASVTSFSPNPEEVIAPSIAGALNALEAADKEPGLRRFILTSSTAAAVSSGNGVRHEVTSESWNMSAFKAAWQPPPYEADRAWAVYSSSKFQTEQAVWKWNRQHRPRFTINTILPGMLFGRMLDSQNQGLPPSVALLKLIFDGNAAATALSPPQYFTDVQDSARLHLAALVLPDIHGQRIFAATEPYNINSLLSMLRATYPNRMFPGDVSDHGIDLSVFAECDKALEMLRRMGHKDWTDLETSVSRNVESFFFT